MDDADRDVVLHDEGVGIPVKLAARHGGGERPATSPVVQGVLCHEGGWQGGVDDADRDIVLHDDGVGILVKGAVEDGGNERAAPSRLLQG